MPNLFLCPYSLARSHMEFGEPQADAMVFGLDEYLVARVSFVVSSDDENARVLGSVYEIDETSLALLDERMVGHVRQQRVGQQLDRSLVFIEIYVLEDTSLLAGSWNVEKMSMSLPG